MKNVSLLLSFLLLIAGAQAQPGRGRFLVGGSLNFNHSRSSGTGNQFNLPISSAQELGLTAGYFVANNFLVGATGSYSSERRNYRVQTDWARIDKSHSVGLLARRYFPLGKQFYFSFEGGIGLEQFAGIVESGGNELPFTNNGLRFGIGPGVSYSFGKRLLFEINLGQLVTASSSKLVMRDNAGIEKARIRSTQGGFGPGGSIPFNIGFNILLGK